MFSATPACHVLGQLFSYSIKNLMKACPETKRKLTATQQCRDDANKRSLSKHESPGIQPSCHMCMQCCNRPVRQRCCKTSTGQKREYQLECNLSHHKRCSAGALGIIAAALSSCSTTRSATTTTSSKIASETPSSSVTATSTTTLLSINAIVSSGAMDFMEAVVGVRGREGVLERFVVSGHLEET